MMLTTKNATHENCDDLARRRKVSDAAVGQRGHCWVGPCATFKAGGKSSEWNCTVMSSCVLIITKNKIHFNNQ